jgi:thiamine-phosphate pyrophosphorylase
MMSRTAAARIVDANLNRCREGLRTAEEYLRFVLGDRGQAGAFRALRHDLAASADRCFDRQQVVSARDSAVDVGARSQTDCRKSTADIAGAALSRCSEALRAIEEYGALLSENAAQDFAALRFRLYALEKEFSCGHQGRPERLEKASLYVLLTESLCANHDVVATCRAAAAGGATIFQYREKEMEDGQFLKRARELATVCAELEVLLIINDRPHIARLCGADGVHLGQGDLSAEDARAVLGPGRLVGRSTHSPEQARAALAEGADYIGIGPVFETKTKQHRNAVGVSYAAYCHQNIDLPGFAIGSVNEETIDEVLSSGIGRVAVCTGVTMRKDPQAASSFYCRKLDDS